MNNIDYINACCDLVELYKIRNFIELKALEYGLNSDAATKVALAVDEACTNLIEHAFKFDKNKTICIATEKIDKKMVVSIIDQSQPFNPLSVQKQNMEEYFREFKKGGLGIQLMRSVMDDIEYYPASSQNNQNVLKLIKNIE
jgi:serine/threonine-protein kinase RsbW